MGTDRVLIQNQNFYFLAPPNDHVVQVGRFFFESLNNKSIWPRFGCKQNSYPCPCLHNAHWLVDVLYYALILYMKAQFCKVGGSETGTGRMSNGNTDHKCRWQKE